MPRAALKLRHKNLLARLAPLEGKEQSPNVPGPQAHKIDRVEHEVRRPSHPAQARKQ
jgi:hypothetical protein